MGDQFIACICEGNAEEAILKILLEGDKLIFSEKEIINLNDLQLRNAKKFALPKLYIEKAIIEKVVTAPEIEILVIIDQGKYEDFQKYKSKKKPSEYCKERLKIDYKKSYKFIYTYFSAKLEALVRAIQEYRRISKNNNGELTLADLLKCNQ